MAANQVGKTWAAGFETAMHLTGRYPQWWVGKTYDKPVRWIAGSESSELTKKGVQRILFGPPENEELWGTGAIPKRDLLSTSRKPGVPDALAGALIQHISGGVSSIQLQSYDQGRSKWQADTLDGAWLDEEPPEDVYFEVLTRTNTTLGPVYTTMTPLKGVSNIVKRFYLDKIGSLTMMTVNDAPHFSEQQRREIIASYPEFERNARTKGIPQLGSGRVFPIGEESIACAAFPIPAHWPRICGIDFGWDHPSAAVQCAWDKDADVFYVIAAHRQREQTPTLFAASVKPWGEYPWAWPHDGLQHDKGSGEQLAVQYKTQGLKMLGSRATFEDGSNGVEAGIMDMLERMQTARFKVFIHLLDWFEEFNLYHRKDGLIVKKGDDLISASRYAYMMRRFAEVKGQKRSQFVAPSAPMPQGWMS